MRPASPGAIRNVKVFDVGRRKRLVLLWAAFVLVFNIGTVVAVLVGETSTAYIAEAARGGGLEQFHLAGPIRSPAVEGIVPGRSYSLPGGVHITVISGEPWHLDVTTAVVTERGEPAHSVVTHALTPYAPYNSYDSYDSGHDDGAEGIRAGERLENETYRINLSVTPSWDDPPGIPLHALVEASLSEGASLTASYVSPPAWPVDYEGEVTLSYFVSGGMEFPQDGVLMLTVAAVEGSAPGKKGEPVMERAVRSQKGWHHVTLPSDLPVGEYTYRLALAEGTVIGTGDFTVVPPLNSIDDHTGPAAMAVLSPMNASSRERPAPEARLQVDAATVTAGQVGPWLVRVFNPGVFSLLGAQLYVCLPDDWTVTEANHPLIADQLEGRVCSVLLLGAIPGRSQRPVEFSLLQWPPPGPSFIGLDEPDKVDIYLFVRPGGTDEAVLLRTTQAPLVSLPPGISREYKVSGAVFHDEDQDGRRGDQEKVVGSADIIVNGRVHRKSSRNGSFTLTLPPGVHTIWARTDAGRSTPQFVRVNGEDVTGLQLPFVPDDEGGQLPRYEAFVTSAVTGDSRGVSTRYELRGSHTVGRGRLDWNTSHLGSDGRLFIPGNTFHVDGEWRAGIPRRIRMGVLRPSMPVQAAHKVGIHVPPRLLSSAVPAIFSTGLELGRAYDDYWSCRLVWTGVDWSQGGTRLSADAGQSRHTRMDERGERHEIVSYVSLEGTGEILFSRDGWRYSLGAYTGERRRLSPSCGVSPRDGVHLSLGLHPPVREAHPVVERLNIATSRWSAGGRAVEVGLQTFHLPLALSPAPSDEEAQPGDRDEAHPAAQRETTSERFPVPTVRFVPALQWGRDGTDPDEPIWLRPGLVLTSVWGAHQMDVQVGHRPLGEADRQLDVRRGEGRRYVRWRWQPGRVTLLAAWERSGVHDERRRGAELGFSLRDPVRPGTIPGLTTSRLEVKRSHLATRLRDDVTINATLFGQRTKLHLTGRRPRKPGDELIVWFTTYETLRMRASVQGVMKGGPDQSDVSWELSLEADGSLGESSRETSVSLSGDWQRGRWGLETGHRRRERVLGTNADVFVHAQATCTCGPWQLEGGIHHVVRRSVPKGTGTNHDLAALRFHAGRPLTTGLSSFVQLTWSRRGDADGYGTLHGPIPLAGMATRSSVGAGLEWAPLHADNPVIFGVGLRYSLDDVTGDGERLGWFIHVRTPVFSQDSDRMKNEGKGFELRK